MAIIEAVGPRGVAMDIATGLDGMVINEAVTGLRGVAIDIAMGLRGMAMDKAAGLGGTAMDGAAGLELIIEIFLAVVQGQTRGIRLGSPD